MTLPQPRSPLGAIPVYRAGKPASSDEYKLSSNENPFPPLPGVMEAAARELAQLNRYPDAGLIRLYRALAESLGVPENQLAAGTGSVSVLYSLLAAYCERGDEVVYAWRSFEAYPIAVDLSGATGVQIPLLPDGRHDLNSMARAINDHTKVIMLCTPNNPTGPIITKHEWDEFIVRVPDHVLVVVDEAYVEFVRHDSPLAGLEALAAHHNVVVLRTFSKAYGLAGLRVGYSVSQPEVAETVRKAIAPFSVSAVAQAAAVASLAAIDQLQERVDVVVQSRSGMVKDLRAQGWVIPQTHGNFVWLSLGDRALEFADHCWPVSVRPFAGEGVRVSVGAVAANAEFTAKAAQWASRS